VITDMLSTVQRKIKNKVDAALLGNPPSPLNLSWAITLAGSPFSREPAELSRELGIAAPRWAQGREPTGCHDPPVVSPFHEQPG